MLIALLCAGCGGGGDSDEPVAPAASAQGRVASGSVTISGDDSEAGSLTWTRPEVGTLDEEQAEQAQAQAGEALEEGRLYDDGESAIPLYLALLDRDADDGQAREGLEQARRRLVP